MDDFPTLAETAAVVIDRMTYFEAAKIIASHGDRALCVVAAMTDEMSAEGNSWGVLAGYQLAMAVLVLRESGRDLNATLH